MNFKYLVEKFGYKVLRPNLQLLCTIKIDGKMKRKFFSRSLTANFLQILYNNYSNNNTNFVPSGAPFNDRLQVMSVANGLISSTNITIDVDPGLNDIKNGIVVGQGSTAPAPDNYKMETIISPGTGVNQLTYNAQLGIQGVEIVGNDSTFLLQRILTNNSGADISFNELGIYGWFGGGFSACIVRDVISALKIPNTSSASINYEYKATI